MTNLTTTRHTATSLGLTDGLTDSQVAVLDDLVWHSLATSHARFAEGHGAARRFDPRVAGFVAVDITRPDRWNDLLDLVGPGQVVMVSRAGDIDAPHDWARLGGGFGHQMVLDTLSPIPASDVAIVQLGHRHVAQMTALVELTDPGPFRPRTIDLGDYFGVFDGADLIAMAGERLRTPDFTELSAVCTHPSARGRGLASTLSHHVATGIIARGQRPILHVSEHKPNARRIYERLGFVVRRRLEFVALKTPPQRGERR